jgi:hypothetical protein
MNSFSILGGSGCISGQLCYSPRQQLACPSLTLWAHRRQPQERMLEERAWPAVGIRLASWVAVIAAARIGVLSVAALASFAMRALQAALHLGAGFAGRCATVTTG